MRKYIREMLHDLIGKKDAKKDKSYIPPIPKATGDPSVVDLDVPPHPATPQDLENQILSKNPAERTRQLDFQAQQNEQRETS